MTGRRDPQEHARSVEDAFDRAVELFDGRRFFEAHEYFEFLWKHTPPDERPFWKGLTQFAVALCHCQRGNPRGAIALLGRSAGLLRRYGSPYRGVNVQALLECGRTLARELAGNEQTDEIDFPTFPLS